MEGECLAKATRTEGCGAGRPGGGGGRSPRGEDCGSDAVRRQGLWDCVHVCGVLGEASLVWSTCRLMPGVAVGMGGCSEHFCFLVSPSTEGQGGWRFERCKCVMGVAKEKGGLLGSIEGVLTMDTQAKPCPAADSWVSPGLRLAR